MGVYFVDRIDTVPERREVLRRPFDTWGYRAQRNISRLRKGTVGLGSVGCIVAGAVARIGVSKITLIDRDAVEEHNFNRLLYASLMDVVQHKVELADRKIRDHATGNDIQITAMPLSIQEKSTYEAAI